MRFRCFVAALIACSLGVVAGCPSGTDLGAGSGDNVIPDVPVPNDNVIPDVPAPDENVIPDAPAPDDHVVPAAPVPDQLTGQWNTILTYVPAYYTGYVPTADFTGSIGVYYYFWPDGQYEYDLNSALASGFCIRTTRWKELGTVSIAGSDFTFSPTRAINSIMDSCGESAYVDPAPAETVTLTVTPEQDQTGWPLLRLILPSGEELLLEKCRDCQ